MSRQWNRNPRSGELPRIEDGDGIILQLDDTFRYNVRADVVTARGDDVEAKVTDIFDREGMGRVEGGEVTGLVGEVLKLKIANVFKVIKREDHS